MAYKKGAGAAAVAGYGAATRDVTATAKMWEGIESLWGSAQDIGVSVALKKEEADTAWEEYETGYKELGGEGFERPKFGEKGYFKGPEGEVQIGGSLYDRSKIQKAGAFLGTPEAVALYSQEGGDAARKRYLKRTVPGREISSIELQQPSSMPSSTARLAVTPTTSPSWPSQDYNQQDTRGAKEPIQESEDGGVDPNPRGPNLGSMWSQLGSNVGKGLKSIGDYGKAVVGTVGYRLEQAASDIAKKQSTFIEDTIGQRYTDKQRQPYMEPQMNTWDSQIENNKNRRPYGLRPPEIY